MELCLLRTKKLSLLRRSQPFMEYLSWCQAPFWMLYGGVQYTPLYGTLAFVKRPEGRPLSPSPCPSPLKQVLRPSIQQAPSLYPDDRNILISKDLGTQRRIWTNRLCQILPSIIRSYPLCPIILLQDNSSFHQIPSTKIHKFTHFFGCLFHYEDFLAM